MLEILEFYNYIPDREHGAHNRPTASIHIPTNLNLNQPLFASKDKKKISKKNRRSLSAS